MVVKAGANTRPDLTGKGDEQQQRCDPLQHSQVNDEPAFQVLSRPEVGYVHNFLRILSERIDDELCITTWAIAFLG